MSASAALLEGIRAIRFLEAAGHPEPLLLLYHPPARTNPFQRLLYQEGWSRGIVALPVADLADAEAIAEVARGRVAVVLHLHWLNGVTERAETADGAGALAAAFLARLDALRTLGCHLAWTIHNALPHDVRFEEAAVFVRRGVVERAAMVHALASSTSAAVAPWFEVPADRLVVIPHPSYAGLYPATVTREAARFELGLWPDELVFLAFGAIRPYKGIDGLLAAWRAAASSPPAPRRLVVAGAVPPGPASDELLLDLAVTPDVVAFPRRIEDHLVAEFFGAADVAVLTRTQALNSGVLLLALTFGLPVVAPRFAAAVELLDDRVALLFEPGDQDGLVDALRRAPELVAGHPADHARAIAARFDPAEISLRFVDELRRRVGAAG
ncbi:MAG TPA: glycosyltransferase [Candidatus Nanopelagicales bacterium]|nr:glycosyltransferase [Candidatus Nanopelagicales bacterium]